MDGLLVAPGKASYLLTDRPSDYWLKAYDIRLYEQPKPKIKKTPSRVDRDRRQHREYWKRMKDARQLRAENLAAHFAWLQETSTVASSKSHAVSHSKN